MIGLQPSPGSSRCFLNQLIAFEGFEVGKGEETTETSATGEGAVEGEDVDSSSSSVPAISAALKAVEWREGYETQDSFKMKIKVDFSPPPSTSEAMEGWDFSMQWEGLLPEVLPL